MTLVSRLSINIDANLVAALDLASGSVPLLKSYSTVLQTGTGAGQADRIYHDQRTLVASATEDLDLAGSLTDAFGSALTFAKIKALVVSAAAGNTNNVLVGGVAAGLSTLIQPQSTGLVVVRPGATFAVFAGAADATGYAVTATTADLLHVANSSSGTPVTYDIVIIGTSS